MFLFVREDDFVGAVAKLLRKFSESYSTTKSLSPSLLRALCISFVWVRLQYMSLIKKNMIWVPTKLPDPTAIVPSQIDANQIGRIKKNKRFSV